MYLPLQVVPTNKDMEDLLENRRQRVLARNRLREDARANNRRPACDIDDLNSQEVFCFWHSVDYVKDRKALPQCAVRSLKSLSAIGQIKVTLLVYQEFNNVPAGIEVVRADAFFAVEEFNGALKRSVHVAVLADLVRMLAIQKSTKKMAWFWDVDCLCLRILIGAKPVEWGLGPESFGFVFASIEKPPGTPWGIQHNEMVWAKQGLTKPRDKRWTTSPFRFVVGTQILNDLVDGLRAKVVAASSHDGDMLEYNCFMKDIQQHMLSWGLEDAVLDVSQAAGIPAHAGTRPLQPRFASEFDWQKVAADSLCVNYYAQSGKNCKDIATKRGADSRAVPGCAWRYITDIVDKRIAQPVTNPAPSQDISAQLAPEAASSSQKNGSSQTYVGKVRCDVVAWPAYPTWAWDDLSSFEGMAPHRQALLSLQNRWALQRVIGSGNFGTVYEAQPRSPASSQAVAIKVMIAKSFDATLSLMEPYLMQGAAHENVTALYDAWLAPHMCVMVTPLG